LIYRIRHARDFRRLQREGRSVRIGAVRLRVRLDDGDGVHVAYALGRAHGTAVARNRLRRRLRAIVADADRRGEIPAGWYLVSMSPGDMLNPAELTEAVCAAIAEGSLS
jgi:ribonuclease P protein component